MGSSGGKVSAGLAVLNQVLAVHTRPHAGEQHLSSTTSCFVLPSRRMHREHRQRQCSLTRQAHLSLAAGSQLTIRKADLRRVLPAGLCSGTPAEAGAGIPAEGCLSVADEADDNAASVNRCWLCNRSGYLSLRFWPRAENPTTRNTQQPQAICKQQPQAYDKGGTCCCLQTKWSKEWQTSCKTRQLRR